MSALVEEKIFMMRINVRLTVTWKFWFIQEFLQFWEYLQIYRQITIHRLNFTSV